MRPYDRISTDRVAPYLPGRGTALLSIAALLIFAAACTPIPTAAPDEASAPQADTPDAATTAAAPTPCQDSRAPWGYGGDNGPEHWAALSPCFALCETGKAQSPVAIEPSAPSALPPLRFQYQEAPLRVANTGRTVQFEVAGGNSLDFGEMTFGLRQVQVHAPSEHTLRGREFSMELHLVHSARDSMAVVSVFVEAGDDNPTLATLWEHLPPDQDNVKTIEGVRWNPSGLLPQSPASHRYGGSLTVPPCSENVRWIVMDEPITLSREKIDAFRALYDGNHRPRQDLGNRQVTSGD